MDFALDDNNYTTVYATITPNDALALDDNITLTLSHHLSIPVKILGDCGKHLRSAIDAHPRLDAQITKTIPSVITIACTSESIEAQQATLIFRKPMNTKYLKETSTLTWLPDIGLLNNLHMEPSWLSGLTEQIEANSGTALLTLDNKPLIVSSMPSEPKIEVFFDIESPGLVYQPQYPVLVAGLVDLLLSKQSAIGEIFKTQHPISESTITPQALAISNVVNQKTNNSLQTHSTDLSPFFIFLSVFVFLVDCIIKYKNLPIRKIKLPPLSSDSQPVA